MGTAFFCMGNIKLFDRELRFTPGLLSSILHDVHPQAAGLGLYAWLVVFKPALCSPTSAGLGLLTKTKNATDLPHIAMLFAPIFSIPEMRQKWPTIWLA